MSPGKTIERSFTSGKYFPFYERKVYRNPIDYGELFKAKIGDIQYLFHCFRDAGPFLPIFLDLRRTK